VACGGRGRDHVGMSTEGPDPTDDSLLLPGLTWGQLRTAARKSGYPLQTTVSRVLQGRFRIQSEWGFFDRVTQEMRSIDLKARLELCDSDIVNSTRARPTLDLLIECKQAELPYVFFDHEEKIIEDFPQVSGLRSGNIRLWTDDDESTWELPVLHTLDLGLHPFVIDPPGCSTFSKCARKGADIQLSGTDAYHGLVLPIRSAVQHAVQANAPVATAHYFDATLVLGLAVLDAPMIAVHSGANGDPSLAQVSWRRVWRHEPRLDAAGRRHGETSAIDIVHIDFLEDYLQSHLIPFAEEYALRVLRHDEELAEGQGFASGMGNDSFIRLEERLQPRTVTYWPEDPVRPGVRRFSRLIVAVGSMRSAARRKILRWRQRPRR
jgi:hypothetical protein